MCGRINQLGEVPAVTIAAKLRQLSRRKTKEREDRRAQSQILNNICPTDYADVITRDTAGEDGIERMRFGLLPHWARGSKAEVWKKFVHTFNARCETVFDLASFRQPVRRQRCIVPVRGWHEWPDRTTPFYIRLSDDAPILLAAIWDVWESKDAADVEGGPVVTSMSIITTPPGGYMGKFHDRSPLFLSGEESELWLDHQTSEAEIKALFTPHECNNLEAYRVSTAANSARNKTSEVLQPIADPVPHG